MQSESSASTVQTSHSGAEEYLTFMLANEEFGVDILRVQGIQGWSPVTPIPHAPDYVLGVTNLRGAVVPIIDLRARFDLPEQTFGPTTVVIVVNIIGTTRQRVVGMVVDGVSEVYALDEVSVQPPPDFGCSVDTTFIRGLSTVDDRMLILLDIDQLLKESVDNVAPDRPHLVPSEAAESD